MNRRNMIKASALGALAASSGSIKAAGHGKTGYLFVHGSWHGGWCWSEVMQPLQNDGHPCVAIDLPGCGLNAISPDSYYERPLDHTSFATEVSQFAQIQSDAFADSVLDGVKALKALGADKVVAVGHSMGGMPITLAAAKDPAAIQELVFLTALTAVPGKPSGAYISLPEQAEKSQLGPLVLADPAQVGCLRIDVASTNHDYQRNAKSALAADVDEDIWRTAVNMMTPDAPVAIYGEMIEFPDDYGKIARTFIRCANDNTLLPSTQDAMIADMDAAWPDNACKVIEFDSSHEAMFANPDGLVTVLKTLV